MGYVDMALHRATRAEVCVRRIGASAEREARSTAISGAKGTMKSSGSDNLGQVASDGWMGEAPQAWSPQKSQQAPSRVFGCDPGWFACGVLLAAVLIHFALFALLFLG